MPKLGMEPLRREALIAATIDEIGSAGTLDVTVAQIARRAGMSSGLAHHYFGGKDDIFLAAVRHVLKTHLEEISDELKKAETPYQRIEGIIRASFEGANFRPEVIACWTNFYVLAQRSDMARRLLRVYQSRTRSNLAHALRPLVGEDARRVADNIAAMIDGVYLQQGLVSVAPDGPAAVEQIMGCVNVYLHGIEQK